MNNSLTGDLYQYDPDYHKTADMLGINEYDRKDFESASKISFLVDWANRKRKTKPEISRSLIEVEVLRKKIGTQAIGKTLLNQLYQYVRLIPQQNKKTLPRVKIPPKKDNNEMKKKIGELKKEVEELKAEKAEKPIMPEPITYNLGDYKYEY